MILYFPLVLSCGHEAQANCHCYRTFTPSNTDGVFYRAGMATNGRWRTTLESYGCKLPASKGKHGPCPVCGGKDRFRFDDKDNRGTFICNQCGAGDGLQLLSIYLGKPIKEVAEEIAGGEQQSIAPVREFISDDKRREDAKKSAAAGAAMLLQNAIKGEHPYMDAKGLAGEWLLNGDPLSSPEGIIKPGELLLVPAYKEGKLVNVQKIKMNGDKRPITGGEMSGVMHVIEGKTATIGIAEGFATGVTTHRMTGYTVFVAFTANNLAEVTNAARKMNPGSKLVIFADNDPFDEVHRWFPGLHFAEQAATPTGAKIALPPELGDWDDYRQRHGEESCKAAMREAIKLDGHTAAPFEAPPNQLVMPDFDNLDIPTFAIMLPGDVSIPNVKEPPKGDGELPHGISFAGMNIDNPPGLAGRIVDYIRSGAMRELKGGAYAVMAIQCMAMAAAGLIGYAGSRTSLLTIIIAESGAGKDRAQEVIEDFLSVAGRNIYGDIRSDKDILRSAVYDQGRCFYIVDEVQKLIKTTTRNSTGYNENVQAVIMNIATTKKLNLSNIHREEFGERLRNTLARKSKEKGLMEESVSTMNPEHDKVRISQCEQKIKEIDRQLAEHEIALDSVLHGIKNPCMNLAGSSTPREIAGIIQAANLESGFLARALVMDCGEVPSRINFNLTKVNVAEINVIEKNNIQAEINYITELANKASAAVDDAGFSEHLPLMVSITPGAASMLDAIMVHYEDDRYRLHPHLGALYRRITERVKSLASIMAFGAIKEGKAEITEDHVRYALMISLQSIKNMESNLRVNEAESGDTIEEQVNGIKEKIIRKLRDYGDWMYKSKIKDAITKKKYYREIEKALKDTGQDAFNNALSSLTLMGEVEVEGTKVRSRPSK